MSFHRRIREEIKEVRRGTEEGGIAFLTYFPHIDELKLLYQAEIRIVLSQSKAKMEKD